MTGAWEDVVSGVCQGNINAQPTGRFRYMKRLSSGPDDERGHRGPLPIALPPTEINSDPTMTQITWGQKVEAEPHSAGCTGLHPWWGQLPDGRNTCHPSPKGTCSLLQSPSPYQLQALISCGFSPLAASLGEAFMGIRKRHFHSPKTV